MTATGLFLMTVCWLCIYTWTRADYRGYMRSQYLGSLLALGFYVGVLLILAGVSRYLWSIMP